MPPDPSIPLQRALAGRYTLEGELGRGGMGIVYLAEEIALERKVALKVLPPVVAASRRRRERLLREARTAAKLSHPNIVPILAADEVDEFVFFTMAYVEGETLARRVRVRGPLSADEVTHVLREVAGAVAYAHERGVIHRDLKAENIILEHATGRALVMDFGIARVASEPDVIDAGKVAGTAQYMSPEQAQGLDVDERTDVYALGVVGYFASTGRLPFQGSTPKEVMEQQIHAPPPPLVPVTPGFHAPVVATVERCLEKYPGDRFQSAADLVAQLGVPGDVPAPLRYLVRRYRDSIYGNDAVALLGALAAIQLFGALWVGKWGTAALAGGFLALLVVGAVASLLPVTRRVLQNGYSRSDIVGALTQDVATHREELAFRYGWRAGLVERLARAVTFAGVGLWKSRFGVWAAKLAGVGLKRRLRNAESDRGPEAIVVSADRLYQNLPEAARRALGDLPDMLRRLERQTMGTRTLIAELEAGLASGGDVASALSRERERMSETIDALEAIRLALERLADGDGSVQEVSAELGRAREVGDVVDGVVEPESKVLSGG